MYDFPDDYAKNICGSKVSLLLHIHRFFILYLYETATEDVYLDMQGIQHHFNLSDYPEKPFHQNNHKQKGTG